MENLIVPPEIDNVILEADNAREPITPDDIRQRLINERKSLKDELSEASNLGAWSEIVAFGLQEESEENEPWHTYFGPMGSGIDRGNTVFFPDVFQINAAILDQWQARTTNVNHPVLKARYADLLWELSPHIDGRKRNPNHARLAIDCYLQAIDEELTTDFHDIVQDTCRALDLAILMKDRDRIIKVRNRLLSLHQQAVETERFWIETYDRLIDEKRAEITDDQRRQLVDSLEKLFKKYADISDPSNFNPFEVEVIAKRLIRYYGQIDSQSDIVRVHETVARAFEQLAKTGTAMQAVSYSQSAENAFLQAGLKLDAKRMRLARAKAVERSHDEMSSFETTNKVSKDDMEIFLSGIIRDNLGNTFARIANEFVWRMDSLEESVQELAKSAPIQAMIPMQIMSDDHIVAEVGSVEDDMDGRLFQLADQNIHFQSIYLDQALRRAIDVHDFSPHDLTGFVARSKLFDDLSFVFEGIVAWFAEDFAKLLFILPPQFEYALRRLASDLGIPVTKAHASMPGREVAINMGDILSSQEVRESLGDDLIFYFKVIFNDPRGLNLRNLVTHGLANKGMATRLIGNQIIHALLVLGVWREIAESREQFKKADEII